MKLHGNAALSWRGRRQLAERVVVHGWTLTAAAKASGVSVRCARKWVGRYRLQGDRDGLRAFMAVLGEQDVGIFVSAGGFTSEAEREARSQEKRRLTLIDLDRLVELWIEHLDKLDPAEGQRLPLRPIYFLAPPE